jgi:hypothetical protein
MNDCEYREFMIDLETLATTPDAHILSIGACDINNPDITFYHTVEGRDQNRTTNYSTMKWWLKQSKEAIASATSREFVLPLPTMLMDLSSWIKGHGFTHPWSHGSIFDIAILENAYRQCNLPIPWNFWDIRDTRTLYETAYRITGKTLKPVREGIYHNALDDAQFQALWVRNIREILEDGNV